MENFNDHLLSLQRLSVGRSRIKLRKTGEVFSLVPPNSTAHNVIVGSTWVDCHGNFSLTNVSTGAKCSLYFTPCGWFSDGRYQVPVLAHARAAQSRCTDQHFTDAVREVDECCCMEASGYPLVFNMV